MKLSSVGELALLEHIRKSFPAKTKNILTGIGDDAAVIKASDKSLLATTDMMMEGIHFDLKFVTPYQVGYKLVVVNVSDIYAMGGRPAFMLLDMAVNKNEDMKFIDMLFSGIKDALNRYTIYLVGGDVSASMSGTALSATMLGYAKKIIRRSGARAGDRIYVSGCLGDSACGLEMLKRIGRPVPVRYGVSYSGSRGSRKKLKINLPWNTAGPILRRHLLPEARDPGDFMRCATSMIDISDGLLMDLTRLCDESRVGARIYLEKIPISPALTKAASYLGISPVQSALSGGEDYELLFTAPAGEKVKAIYIGDVLKLNRVIVDRAGKEKPFSSEGYSHFHE
jgi:thiamine-monophosphate kinase